MSTRGIIHIVSKIQGVNFMYGLSTDAYPDNISPTLYTYRGNPEVLSSLWVDIIPAANFQYFYKIDSDAGTLTVWQSTCYWVNAPFDWRAQGLHCYQDSTGLKYGWESFRKGKKLEEHHINRSPIQIIPDTRYTPQDIKLLKKCAPYGIRTLKTSDPSIMRTYIAPQEDVYRVLYDMPLEEVPLHIDDKFFKDFYKWRLMVGK